MLRRALARAAIALTVATTALVALEAPAAAAVPRGPFYYAGLDSQRCIDNPRSDPRQNIRMHIWNCLPNANNELWRELPIYGGFVEIENVASGLCLTVQNASSANNAAIIQYECSGATNAQWAPIPAYDGVFDYYALQNRNSGKCLSVRNASVALGALLLQHDCAFNGSYNNVWTWFTPADLPTFLAQRG